MSTITVIEGAGIYGGAVIEVSGYERLAFPELRTPFDPSKLYRVSARLTNTVRPSDPARNKIRVGVEGFAADGVTPVDRDGLEAADRQFFVAADLVDLQQVDLEAWLDCAGYIQGLGVYVPNAVQPDAPSGIHPDVAFIQPVVWVNCTDGDGTVQIDAVKLDVGGVASDVAAVGGVSARDVVGVVQVRPDDIPDRSTSGPTGYFDVAPSVQSAFGKVLALWPMDGKMYKANIYDSSSNAFMAIDLGLGIGVQKLALPGSILRDDTLNLLPGREIYLADTAGDITQTESFSDMRFTLGRALTPKLWHFDPQPRTLLHKTPFSGRHIHWFNEAPWSLIDLGPVIYVGCSNARIYRSWDYGLTWTLVYQGTGGSAAAVNAFEWIPPWFYAVIDKGTDAGCKCVRTTDGLNWTVATIGPDPYVYDLKKERASNLLMACTGNPSGYGKIYTSTDGQTWTLRYTSGTEPDIMRLSIGSTYDWALAGNGSAVRALRSSTGTSWSVSNSYTGSYVPSDLITYVEPVNAATYSCVMVGDTGRIYGSSSGTSIDVLETTQAGVWWENFIVIDGYLYAVGTSGSSTGQLWKRVVTTAGAVSWVKVQEKSRVTAWRYQKAVNNDCVYYLTNYDNGLWRVAERCSVVA